MGFLAIALAAVLWGVAGAGSKVLFLGTLTPLMMTAVRSWVAGGIFSVPFLLRLRPWPRLSRAAIGGLLFLGALLATVNFTYYLAISYIPVAVAIVLQYTAPLWIVVAEALFIRKRVPLRQWLIIVASLVSCAALVGLHRIGIDHLDWFGLGIALLSAWAFAGYSVCGHRLQAKGISTTVMLPMSFVVASGIWLIVLCGTGALVQFRSVLPWPGMLAVAVFGTVLPFALYLWGLRTVPPFIATMVAMLEVLTASVIAWWWLGETLDPLQVAGMIGVLVCVTLVGKAPAQIA